LTSAPRVAAVVPFKRFTRAKSRLRHRFPDAAVEALVRAMLADVLEALIGARSVERVVVLTDDVAVAEAAREAGAAVRLRDPDPGLNAAIDGAAAELAAEGIEALLVAVGDIPLLRSRDVDAVVELGRGYPVVLVPSSDGGTALLYRRPPRAIPARFGPQSAAAHEAEARARGLPSLRAEELGRALLVDLDTPEDAEQVLKADVPSRTRDVLLELAR
jgi:2-phospho-L-lactate guanylyltransferase